MPDIQCPLCGAPSKKFVGRLTHRGLCRCSSCSNTFDPEGIIEAPSQQRSRALVRRLDAVPEGIVVRRSSASKPEMVGPYRHMALRRDNLEVRLRPSRKHALGPVVALVIMLGVVLGLMVWEGLSVAALVAGGVFAMLWALLAYDTAMDLFNSKILKVEGDTLSVFEGPLPGVRKLQFAAQTVDQLWVERVLITQDEAAVGEYFRIMLRTTGASEHAILNFPETAAQALWIEQQIEDCLGIVDVATDREIGPHAGGVLDLPQ